MHQYAPTDQAASSTPAPGNVNGRELHGRRPQYPLQRNAGDQRSLHRARPRLKGPVPDGPTGPVMSVHPSNAETDKHAALRGASGPTYPASRVVFFRVGHGIHLGGRRLPPTALRNCTPCEARHATEKHQHQQT